MSCRNAHSETVECHDNVDPRRRARKAKREEKKNCRAGIEPNIQGQPEREPDQEIIGSTSPLLDIIVSLTLVARSLLLLLLLS